MSEDGKIEGEERTRTVVTDARGVHLRSRKIRVEIVAGPDRRQPIFELSGPEARVGSSRGCDLTLSDSSVSRHHLTLRVEERGLRVTDMASRNGTTLDGVRILDGYAQVESIIGLGESRLRLRLLDDVVEVPLSPREHLGAMSGKSVAMRQLFALLERVAPTDATVLVEGETGTGKELAAEAIHEHSRRSAGAFVVFDCSAVSAGLIESELFGHVRGAFTGAVGDRAGAFESADGGTLFLDEIGELPLALQPKLLRALQRREVRRVGSNKARKVDVRIVAATHRSLQAEVERGAFREDLYYRLAVVLVSLPSLRDRAEDIPLLVEGFLRDLTPRGQPVVSLPAEVVHAWRSQPWPGNVRELRNAVERALSVGLSQTAVPALSRPTEKLEIDLAVPLKRMREQYLDALTRAYVVAALHASGGVVTRAAEIAGVNRKFIQRAIRQYGLRDSDED